MVDIADSFGIKMVDGTTWLNQNNDDKKTVWTWMTLIRQRLDVVKNNMGISGSGFANLSAQLELAMAEIEAAIA